eukprot:1868974-Amphidinium_carterae.6
MADLKCSHKGSGYVGFAPSAKAPESPPLFLKFAVNHFHQFLPVEQPDSLQRSFSSRIHWRPILPTGQ